MCYCSIFLFANVILTLTDALQALKDTAAMRKKVQEVQKFGVGSDSSNSRARLARRAMGGAGKNSATRILSEDELRVKKWLDKRIADINAREEAADTLRKQCEQQLALLNKKEALELEKSSLEKSMRDVMTGSHGEERILSKEEEEAMREIEDRLESVDSQLKLKDRNIFEIESKLVNGDIASAQESTIEALKRNSAVSLPASHELIRLLFDMLVATKSSSQQRKGSLARSAAREKQLRQELDDAARHMVTLRRTHDMELTRTANEYEEKLAGLFTHSTIGKLVRAESGMEPAESSMESLSPETTPTASKYKSSADTSYKMLLSVASEQSNLLRSRLEREAARTIELQGRIAEVDHTCSALQRDLDEREVHIKFLEDERALFRDLADSLRAGISTLGGETGHTILRQIKDRVAGAVASDESDDETESMLGEYSNLGDIITRTGNVTEKKRNHSSDRNLSSLSATLPIMGGRDVVYDRLTNPSNFTGSMKNAFGDDLAGKREKVKQIKSANISNKKETRANHNKEHIAAYLEGTATPDSSSELTGIPMPPPRGSFLAVAKDSTMNRAKLSGPGTPLARTTTPPASRLNGTLPNPGPRVKSLAFVKAGLASITLQLTDIEESRPRSSSMTLAEPLKRLPIDLSPKSMLLTEIDVDATSTVPETDAEETSPIHLTTIAGMVRKPWSEKEADELNGRSRRNSVESVYSSVIEEEKFTEEEKLIITIPNRHLIDENATPEEYEAAEMERIAALDAARAEEDCGFEDEENYCSASGGSSVNGTSRSREQTHLLKIKNRLQAATAPMTPVTPRSPLPKPTNVILKK